MNIQHKTWLPIIVGLIFVVATVVIYSYELTRGGYTAKVSSGTIDAVALAMEDAQSACQSPAIEQNAGEDWTEKEKRQNLRCRNALGRLQQFSSSARMAAEFVATASESSYRATAYHRQGALGVVVLTLVVVLVLSGLYFTYLNVVGLSSDGTTETALEMGSVKLKTPVIGAAVLIASMGFFYLYLMAVFEIRDSRDPMTLAKEVSYLKEAIERIEATPESTSDGQKPK